MKLLCRSALSGLLLLAIVSPGTGATGVFKQIPLPSPNSGPTSVLATGIGVLFTEFNANKIGFLTRDGRIIEYPIPTPDSGPMDLDISCGGGSNCDVWFTEFLANKIGKLNPHTGEFQEFPVPTSASGPHSIVSLDYPSEVWFTEFHANKIGRLTADGRFTEFEIPTLNSGPMGIARDYSPNAIWFTEFHAGKLGQIQLTGGPITELAIPTPSSGPTDIAFDNDGRMVFTEFLANKVGHLAYGRRAITETIVPTASSGPFRICKTFVGNPETWFTERLAGKVAVIRANGAITEYEMPGHRVEPLGCSYGRAGTWYAQKAGNALGWAHHDALVVPAAGTFGGWQTTLHYSNAADAPTALYAGYYREPIYVCGACPWQGYARLTARGTGLVSVGPGPSVIYSRSVDRGDLPAFKARARNITSPQRATDLPATRLSTIALLDPSVLVFPGAFRTATGRSNLFIAEVEPLSEERPDPVSLRIDVFSPEGNHLGSEPVTVYSGGRSFFVDSLGRLGIDRLTNGQIRVTKTGGAGLLWGSLTTIDGDAVVTDSGTNLSLPDENVTGGDPLVVLGGAVGDWDTEFDIANARGEPLNGTIEVLSCTIGAACPQSAIAFTLPPNGTLTLRARDFPGFPDGFYSYGVRFAGTGALPTLRARAVNRARPSQTAVLPALHLSAIRKLDGVPLSFPGAAHSDSGARSNLILGETGSGDVSGLVQVFNPSGALLKAIPVLISSGRTIFLQDILRDVGADIENAHVLVTRVGGEGTLWGVLATIDRNQTLSVGWGVHP